jgi:phosphatidylserine/phosphatidylglycerophosphate/cardiolipin synthase-like enzyme
MAGPILSEGRNCWRIAAARRLSFLVDGAQYFSAFAESAGQAQQSILIVGWDIRNRFRLWRDGRRRSLPSELGDFLKTLLSRRPGLHVYLLGWDFTILFGPDRELLPLIGLGWPNHRRLHFRFDNRHPPLASHHQKIVVIDDAVGFVGGLDFAKGHWDTSEHRVSDSRRLDAPLGPALPFHDVQMIVEGDIAELLGDLARHRWLRATGEAILSLNRPLLPRWPAAVAPDIEDAMVAVARTEPAYNNIAGIREIQTLYLDAIAAAERTIYIENQYFTSGTIRAALSARLTEKQGPEIVLVLPCACLGWMEQATMGRIRAAFLAELLASDRFGRLAVYYPQVPGDGESFVVVHSKLIVVDESFVSVGSANLSGRSMALDTECNLAVEADGDPRIQDAIAQFRNRLLAEHLGTTAENVAQRLRHRGSLLRSSSRCAAESVLWSPFPKRAGWPSQAPL